ncbi:MAG: serine/threonine protein kinase [Verrucomicrobia bacterium]|nr:serine/threonine protein kinase [Verrucomicrobiota bacterium]
MSANSDSDSATKLTAPRLLAGQSLKHFRLESVLGEGGMGVVYRAHDSRLHRLVAVKLLPFELTADAERKQRFLQEARAAARISHPAIAQIYDADEQEGVTFIVMELVEGKTVRELIRNKELDHLGAIDVGAQAADGLAKAHELGIVHRDIKPANVMLTPDGHVKILDFGLAKLLDLGAGSLDQPQMAQTQSGMVMGTPAYKSPEQVRGVPVDFRADIFSLGVLLFEMATGKSPFQRDNFMDTLHAVTFDDTPQMKSIRDHVPDELQRIVSRCLRKRADDRYANARLLAEDLRLLKRDTEAGLSPKTSWRQRLLEAWEQLRHLPPGRYVWLGVGAVGLGLALYLSISRIGTGGLVFLSVAALLLYRHVRNSPHKAQEMFVQRVAKIPEVRVIAFQDHRATVVVERPLAQLYGRINHRLRVCNQKPFFGQPMTVSILHEVSAEQLQKLLAGPGVEYVRADVMEKR